MLYIALPYDLRERYHNSEWLVYDKQVAEMEFTPEDVLVLSEWVVSDRVEMMQTIYRIRQQGARIIYVGSKSNETEDLRKQLCLYNVYDFVFFGDEIVLGEIDRLIEQPRTPADVREYIPEGANVSQETPVAVDVLEDARANDTPSKSRELGWKRRFHRRSISRFGERSTPPKVHVVQPRLIAVVSLWPRAGASTIAHLLAQLFVEQLPPNSVSCVEHPMQWPRMWEHFQLDETLPAAQYRHWLDDGVGQSVEKDNVHLVPLSPDHDRELYKDVEQSMVQYIFRQMRRPITVLDCGPNTQQDLLFSMVDKIVCVLDCDPTYLSVKELGKRYQVLTDRYGDHVVTLLNKWTKYAQYPDLFEGAIRVPYLPPDRIQKALWDGEFVRLSEVMEDLADLREHLVRPFIPSDIKKEV